MMARPLPRYRELFFSQLMSEKPESVLDVGAGTGALLARLASEGVSATGLDTDEALVASAQANRLNMQAGNAQALPFEDGSFDFVVSEYALHHFADPTKVVAEMLRVSRFGLKILDQWYDISLGHQRVAKAFDEWFKALDRKDGMVHQPSFASGDLHRIAESVAPGRRARVATLLEAVPYPLEVMLDAAAPYRARGLVAAEDETALSALAAEARTEGLTDDGALVLTLYK